MFFGDINFNLVVGLNEFPNFTSIILFPGKARRMSKACDFHLTKILSVIDNDVSPLNKCTSLDHLIAIYIS